MTIQQNIPPTAKSLESRSKGLATLDVCSVQNCRRNQLLTARILVQASRAIVTRAETLKPLPAADDLVFGKVCYFYEVSALRSLCTAFSIQPIT